MSLSSSDKRQYSVPVEVFAELFNFAGGHFERGKQSGWRKFYSQLPGTRVVTRSNRVNKKSLNITGKHRRLPSRGWCRASFNFTAKLPINHEAATIDFDLVPLNLDLCDCAGGEGTAVLTDVEGDELSINEDSNDSGIGSVASTVTPSIAIRRNSFVEIDTDRPLMPVQLLKDDGSCKEPCKCGPSDAAPCGRLSDCVHVHCGEECERSTCPAGDGCQNQKLGRKDFPPLRVVQTPDRGRGIICLTDVAEGTVMTEYVGELITRLEKKRREQIPGRKGYYVFKITDDLFIDAEYAGSLSRYINHSCEPNTLCEKIKVDGNLRIAIVSNQIISAVSLATKSFVRVSVSNLPF